MKAWLDGAMGRLEWKESAVRELILDFGRRYVIGMSPFNIEDLVVQALSGGTQHRTHHVCRHGRH